MPRFVINLDWPKPNGPNKRDLNQCASELSLTAESLVDITKYERWEIEIWLDYITLNLVALYELYGLDISDAIKDAYQRIQWNKKEGES